MKVMPINYYNYYSSQNKPRAKTVSFQGLGSMLVGVVAKEGIGAIKSRKSVNYLYYLKNYIHSSNLEEFIAGTKALTKTPDAFYDSEHEGWTAWASVFMGKELVYVDKLRRTCLTKLSRIPDNNFYNIQTKKDLMSSCLENGHEISQEFVEEFAKLRDSLYQSFKETIIDTAFFSTRYNQKRVHDYYFNEAYTDLFMHERTTLPAEPTLADHPFRLIAHFGQPKLQTVIGGEEEKKYKKEINGLVTAFDNLKLVSTLDSSYYRSFSSKKRAIIEHYKQMLENYFQSCRNNEYNPPPNTYSEYENILKQI